MHSNVPPPFAELLRACQSSAVHLEMRDQYAVTDEADDYARWKATGERDTDPGSEYWAPWVDLISSARARGVEVRRARIVSEPVSEYIRYEHAATDVNVLAGEQVRWLPRHQAAADIGLPANDFWLFDRRLIRWGYFAGDGNSIGHALDDDPDAVRRCAAAFEAVWLDAVPHDEYKIH
ncbi:DUF6879 family protein [Streptomyces cellulosae]